MLGRPPIKLEAGRGSIALRSQSERALRPGFRGPGRSDISSVEADPCILVFQGRSKLWHDIRGAVEEASGFALVSGRSMLLEGVG
jgi:hypothetical protein